MKRTLLLAAALLLAGACFAQSAYNFQRRSLFEKLPVRRGDIVFLGNSITDGCEWSELFGRRRVLNRGISGDRAEWLLDRLDPIVSGRPAKIFLMIGVNDLSAGRTPEAVAADVATLIDRVAAASPRTRLYVQSVLPINDRDIPDASWAHWKKKAEIVETNRLVEALCRARGIVYIDLASRMMDETGLLDKRYTNDGLHLTGEGYLVWRDAVMPYIR